MYINNLLESSHAVLNCNSKLTLIITCKYELNTEQ